MKLIALAILGFAFSALAQTEVVTTAAQTSKPTSSPKKKTDDDQQKSFRAGIEKRRSDHNRNLCG